MKSARIASSARLSVRLASSLATRAGRWWLAEFLGLFPERTAEWLAGPGRAVLVLASDGDVRTLELSGGDRSAQTSMRLDAAGFSAASIDSFFRAHGVRRRDADIVIRLPRDRFFRRSLILPAQAAASLAEIVASDLVRRTPFRAQDVYHGHSATPDRSGKIIVSQWVVRRAFVRDAAAAFDLGVDDVAFVDSGSGDARDGCTPFIALHPHAKNRRSWVETSAVALACGAVALAVAAAVLEHERQQAMIEANDSRIALVRVRAQKVRSDFVKVQERQNILLNLRSQKRDVPGLLDVWEEVTRLLPAHSWLTELRLMDAPEKNEQTIVMNGFSAGATELVKLVDRSPLLADASLTAPVAVDPVEGRERFALQAKVKRSGAVKEAAR